MFVMLGHIGYLEKRSPANPGHRAVQVHTTLRTPMLRIRHALSLFSSLPSIVPHRISRCITPLVGDGTEGLVHAGQSSGKSSQAYTSLDHAGAYAAVLVGSSDAREGHALCGDTDPRTERLHYKAVAAASLAGPRNTSRRCHATNSSSGRYR